MLYGSYTLDIYSDDFLVLAYLCRIALLAVKQEQRNTVDLFESQRTAVSAVAIHTHQYDGGLVSRMTWTVPKVV